MDKIKGLIEEKIKEIETTGLDDKNIEKLDTLISIHKDLENEDYWKNEKEAMKMRYRDYDESYGRRRRDSRGRYMEGRDYNDEHLDRNYGHHMPEMYWERMMDGYDGYMEGMDRYRRGGNYGDHEKSLESLEYLLDGFVGFLETLQENMESPEEIELIKKYARKLKGM